MPENSPVRTATTGIPTEVRLERLIADIDHCYSFYLSRSQIQVDDHFFIEKLYEEVGEFTRAFLEVRGQTPVGKNDHDRLSEEAADVLCQVLVLIRRLNLTVWSHIDSKWLRELRGEGIKQ